jgi:FkbM family methyltransferase
MAANSVEQFDITANVALSNWQRLQACWRERRLPLRLQQLAPNVLSKLSGRTVFYCRDGRKKFLQFKLEDMPYADHIFREIFTMQMYFPTLNNFATFKIKQGETVIDIGANIGLFATYAASLSGKGRVYCFEPSRKNFARLAYHQHINGLNNLTLVNKGVSDQIESVKLYLTEENCGAHSVLPGQATGKDFSTDKYELIECVPLQQVFDEYAINRCHYLKLDCEGAEAKIISALPATYFKRIDRIAIEYHPNVDALVLAEQLHGHGFHVMIVGYPERAGMIFAIR